MRLSKILMLSACVVLIGSSASFAQPATSTTPTQPAATAPAAPADSSKKAISKACSDQANAKNLHGKERKTFRAACKKNGGKPA